MASHYQNQRQTKHFRRGFMQNGKDVSEANTDQFLVFGYSAKLHNACDEHWLIDGQQSLDENLYLIPWNGDDQLKIDRYDVRLYLNSLDEFDQEQQHRRDHQCKGLLTDAEEEEDTAEKLEEELCEEERFLDLYEDIRKRELEETKHKRGKGTEIGFSYEETDAQKLGMVVECEETTEDEPFEKPPSLKLPLGIVTPETMRQNALIERTAQFVVSQGPQMEVVIKAKQRQNADQFGFLDFDHQLHPYYKYMCKLIREKKYVPQPKQQLTKKRNGRDALHLPIYKKSTTQQLTRKSVKESSAQLPVESESDSENEDDGYLHPSLLGGLSKPVQADISSPQPGFIGPSPRPPPQKTERKPAASDLDLDVLVQQCHRSSSANSLYSSLLKRLHSVLPGTLPKDKSVGTDSSSTQMEQNIPKIEPMGTPTRFESEQQRIDDYNKWHMEFYGRPSLFLPGPPPACQRPVPDSAVESAIAVAAKYVAFHGAFAEQRLIEHNQDKVHFLQPRSPYYTFYQSQVRQIQWNIFQQSQKYRPKLVSASPSFGTSIGNTATVSSPPPISTVEGETLPKQISLPNIIENANDMESKEAEADSKQLERREKARLFMEKILNERMAEKHRTKTNPIEREDKRSGTITYPSTNSADVIQPTLSNALSPLELSKAISNLIDEQIKRTLGTSPPQSPTERKKMKKDKRRQDEEKKRKKKKRSRLLSNSSRSSSTSSTCSNNISERSRMREKRSRKGKKRREDKSESDSTSESAVDKGERRRRRKRKHKGEEDSSSSFSRHRRHHHHRSRSRSSRR